MQVTNKFRLYPSRETEQKMLETLEICRQGYNMLLEELNNQKEIDKVQIQGIIPDMKICDKQFSEVHSKTLQYECYKLFSNLRGLAKTKGKRKVGRLRFKGKGWFKTFTYNQSGFKLMETGKRYQTLWLSKIGNIPIRVHRVPKGKIKQVTIKKMPSGKWFAFVIEEREQTVEKVPIRKVVGIDLGLTDVIYDSEGNNIKNPRHLKEVAERLAYLQKRMSKKKKKSNNRNKARIRLARQYEKLVNTRDDFLHKTSRYYINNYDAVGMEDMPITNMVHNKILSKHILNACWGRFRQFISYKAENAGKLYVPVNYRGTTQRCSQCGEVVHKSLRERKHRCNCGFIAHRDYNSALEIKRLMLIEIGQELPESTPVEMEALPMVTSVKEAGSLLPNHQIW